MDANKRAFIRVHSRLFVVGSTYSDEPRMDTNGRE
jgi:hypothetical protein